MSTLDQLQELKALHDGGDLSDEEFAQAKRQLLLETQPATAVGWLYPLLIVAVVGLVFMITPRKTPDAAPNNKAPSSPQPTEQRVKPRHTYYVFPDLIELAGKNSAGRDWDVRDNGPDITYAIYLNDQKIFRAPSKGKNNTVTEWSGVSQNLSLFNTSVSVEGIIKAAFISINPGDTLRVKVWDNDFAANDEAGEFSISTTALRIGQAEWWRYGNSWREGRDTDRPDATRGLKRLRLHVVDSASKAEFIARQLDLPLGKVNEMLKKLSP
jgi:hypothetical protein